MTRDEIRGFSKPFNCSDTPMNLHHLLKARHAAGKPVRVALIGAGIATIVVFGRFVG